MSADFWLITAIVAEIIVRWSTAQSTHLQSLTFRCLRARLRSKGDGERTIETVLCCYLSFLKQTSFAERKAEVVFHCGSYFEDIF